jgi:WD40 repeat protein/serine/threonine protein kinase
MMIPARDQIDQIFCDALQLPEGERSTYLERACRGDPELRRRVEKLLRAQPKAHDFLERAFEPQATVDETTTEAVGTKIGPYKLLEQIGEGAFGVVFKAEQHDPIRRMVALKVLKPGMDSRQIVARFEAERQALALMDHPHIAKVLDAGQTPGGRPYFVMDLVKGLPITEFCDQHQLTPRERLELFVHVCQAVQHAHQKGVIHRDLKPSNVLVTMQDGKALVKVIDFGIAKALGQRLTDKTLFTGFAQLVGTPLYMSPEQAALSNVDVDTRSDIYSLGVLLYELLTGTTPFDRTRLKGVDVDELRRIIREEEPPRPSTRLSTAGQAAVTISSRRQCDPKRLSQLFRGELDWIVMTALDKDRNRRYESASAFAADVQRYLKDEPVLACPPSLWYRASKFIRRNQGPVLAASAVVLALLVGAAAATWQAVEANSAAANEAQQRRIAEAEKRAAEEATKIAVAKTKIADQRTQEAELARNETAKALSKATKELFRFESMHYIDHIVSADQALQNNDFIAAGWHLNECRLEFRHVEHAYLRKQLPPKEPRQLLGHTDNVVSLAVSSDGKRLCSGGADGTIKVWDVKTGKAILTLQQTGGVFSLALSSDGKRLCSVGGGGTIKVWDLEAGKETLTLPGHTNLVASLALSADGKRLCSGCIFGDNTIKVWDLEAGKETLTLRGHKNEVVSLALSSDGKRLFSGSAAFDGSGEIKVWDVEAGKETLTLRGHDGAVWSLALSSDGKHLYSGSSDRTIKVWDVETAKDTLTLEGHTNDVSHLALSADGKRLWSGSGNIFGIHGGHGGEIKVWDVETGKKTLHLPHYHGVGSLALSPDGKRGFFSGRHDQTITVWDLEPGKEPLTMRGQTDRVFSLAMSSDGKRLCSGSVDGRIKVWDVEAGKELHTLHGPADVLMSLALSADGKCLVSANGDRMITVWDVEAGKKTLTLPDLREVSSLALSADGKRLCSGSGDRFNYGLPVEIKLWDLVAGKDTLTLEGRTGHVSSLALSADGKRLVSANGDRTITVWDLEAGKETCTLRGHASTVLSLALSADGKHLYSGSSDKTIKVWDVETGKETLTLRGHTAEVRALALSPDGKRLFSGSGDKTIKVWNLEAGKETLTLRGHEDVVSSLALSPDGKCLFSGSWDKTIKAWDFGAGN